MKSIIKYPGGKSWLLEYIKELITPDMLEDQTFIEPFAGSAAITFGFEPGYCILNDLNSELINLYQTVSDYPTDLIEALIDMRANYESKGETYYYEVRAWDREENFKKISKIVRAARFMFLNKTCFNGLWRENSKGYMNSPIGRTASGKLPDIVQADRLLELSSYLKKHAKLYSKDYLEITKLAKSGDIIFLDPPYDYTSGKGFTSYNKAGWTQDNLIELKNDCDRLNSLGCKFILTNNNTSFVSELFKDYKQQVVLAKRSINSKGTARGAVEEVIVTNI